MRPQVIFQPTVYRDWQKGIHTITDAIRPTLGPIPRLVANERIGREDEAPEFLDNGGVIARRIIQLENRNEDMGAMFARHIIWRVHEEVGDGTATTAVLFAALYDEGVHYITSGGNAMRLRIFLEKGAKIVADALAEQIRPVQGAQHIAELAESLHYDPGLAEHMGEIFNLIGPYGRFEVRPSYERADRREYMAGSYWGTKILHKQLYLDAARQRSDLKDVYLFLSDWEVESPHELIPLFRLAQQEEIKSLVIVARKLSDPVVGFLHKANKDPDAFTTFGVVVPGQNVTTQAEALDDFSKIVGGTVFPEVVGKDMENLQLSDLGRARSAWADKSHFGISGGRGNGRDLRTHVASLKKTYLAETDPDKRDRLLLRLGQLLGGAAVLYVGGATEPELKAREEITKRSARTLRGATETGILPGGGVALLNCREALACAQKEAPDVDERAAYRILSKMLEAPLRALAANAGQDPSDILAQIQWSPEGNGFDIRRNKVVDMETAGIWDVASVVQSAVKHAIKGAALALTTDVLIQKRIQGITNEP